ncbi:MAG: glycosyltransferase [Rhodospirillales bacterium]
MSPKSTLMRRAGGHRILIYSHDSFGLGHLRRCRAIANALVEQYEDLSVLILSGSPIIGSFDFGPRVDFVRVPGMIKLSNGDYTSHMLDLAPEHTLALRASIIQHTAEEFDPDIFIVDKEPLGLRGEAEETLKLLKSNGTRLVLGLRDVMDDPDQLAPEWERKKAMPALQDLYDEIWVYGLPQICDPLEGLVTPASVGRKITYTGYLRREASSYSASLEEPSVASEPFILVTPGGGGDGEALVDWVLRAYEREPGLRPRALIVFGPFMSLDRQRDFRERVSNLKAVDAITFDANMEAVIAEAAGVVAMGGYNTFCEILSFDKRAIIMPRTRPRMEQHIRASRASAIGLVGMLDGDGPRDARDMATALRQLSHQSRPSDSVVPGLLDGLESVKRLVGRSFDKGRSSRLRLAGSGE